MALTIRHRLLVLTCVALGASCGGDDNSCDMGGSTRCEEHTGPLQLSYCDRHGAWSDCTRAVNCTPLTQEGCGDGLACYFDYPSTFCAPAESFPCEPGEFVGGPADCQAFCAHDGRDGVIFDPPECEEDEWCYPAGGLPEGVGICNRMDV